MDRIREGEIISAVNLEEDPGELTPEEQEYYDALIKEKNDFKKTYGKDVQFELPMEVYDDTFKED